MRRQSPIVLFRLCWKMIEKHFIENTKASHLLMIKLRFFVPIFVPVFWKLFLNQKF